eukprot:1546333-Pyramimonas_sp.AAC.1
MLAGEGTIFGRARNNIRDDRRALPRNVTLESDHERAMIGWCLAAQGAPDLSLCGEVLQHGTGHV